MSKINLEAPFQSFRGKICKHSKIIFAQRGQTQYTSQICNPRTKAYSAEELARVEKSEHGHTRRFPFAFQSQSGSVRFPSTYLTA